MQKDLDRLSGPVLYKTPCERTQLEEISMWTNQTFKQSNGERHSCTLGLGLSAFYLNGNRPQHPMSIDSRQFRH